MSDPTLDPADLFNRFSRVLSAHEPGNERIHYGSASVLAHSLVAAALEASTDGAA